MNIRLLVVIGIFALAGSVYAATPAGTTSGKLAVETTDTPAIGQIENLKERLATKVAELRQTQKKAITGNVKAVSVSTITIETKTSDVKIELTDGIKVFQTIKGKRTTLATGDLEKGDHVVVFGDYDATLDLLKAKVIIIQDTLPSRIAGVIMDIDRKNYTITLKTSDGPTYTVDIWNTTAMTMVDPQKGIIKGGFSKVQTGEIAHVVGTDEPKKDNYVSALRVLDIGFINGTPTPEASGEASQSATESPTPKPTVILSPTAKP